MQENCNGCGQEVTDDGFGELIHVIDGPVESYRYGCKPKARPGETYPVAS